MGSHKKLSAINFQQSSHTASFAIRSEYTFHSFVCLFSRKRPSLPENPEVIYVPRCPPEAVTLLPSPKCVQFRKALIGTRQNVPLLTALISVVLLLAYAPWDSWNVSTPITSSLNSHLL